MNNRELKNREEIGCLTDCTAFILNKHPRSVPFFVLPRKGWADRFRAYWEKQGYKAFWTTTDKVPKKGLWLVCGDSLRWKNNTHAVVYKNGKLLYDPQYPSKWKDKRITHKLILTKIK